MVVFLIVLVTFGALLELLSLRDNLSRIHYHCIPSTLGSEPDEVFTLHTTISNYGLRTIPFLRLEEMFPKEIHVLGEDNVIPNDRYYTHSGLLYIRGRQKVTREVQVSLPKRGLYYFEGCRMFCGDFLGISENSKEIEQREEMIIFPKLLQDDSVIQALSGYYGDFSARRFFTEDPILVSSYREYSGREPMRSISWPQSARKNELIVKEFDHTMDMSATIVLDSYLHWSDGSHTDQIEYCFSLVRTIAEFLEQKKVSYRLLTNAYVNNGSTMCEVLMQAGQGPNHLSSLLVTLARAIPDSFHSPDDLYHIAIQNYSGENAIFYIAPFENEKRANLVKNLRNRLGCQIYPIYAAERLEVTKDAG